MAALLMIFKSLKKYSYLQLELSLVFFKKYFICFSDLFLSSYFASIEFLYTETGWQSLQIRRYAAKMVTMFKFHNGSDLFNIYFNNIIPDKHEEVSSHYTRNKHNYLYKTEAQGYASI